MANDDGKKKKTKRPTALKRDIQNEKRRKQNKEFKSGVRTTIRHFQESVTKGESSSIQENLNNVYSLLDQGVKKGIYKQNTAGRTKSRLTARALAK